MGRGLRRSPELWEQVPTENHNYSKVLLITVQRPSEARWGTHGLALMLFEVMSLITLSKSCTSMFAHLDVSIRLPFGIDNKLLLNNVGCWETISYWHIEKEGSDSTADFGNISVKIISFHVYILLQPLFPFAEGISQCQM
jgi:hypothetical protein